MWSRPNGYLQFRSETLSLHSAMASIVGCFITRLIAREDTALPVLGKFWFQLRMCANVTTRPKG